MTERGYSAAVCGVITSLTLLANLLMEPVGGYLTDTYLSARSYLTVCIGVITGVCLLATLLGQYALQCAIYYYFEKLPVDVDTSRSGFGDHHFGHQLYRKWSAGRAGSQNSTALTHFSVFHIAGSNESIKKEHES